MLDQKMTLPQHVPTVKVLLPEIYYLNAHYPAADKENPMAGKLLWILLSKLILLIWTTCFWTSAFGCELKKQRQKYRCWFLHHSHIFQFIVGPVLDHFDMVSWIESYVNQHVMCMGILRHFLQIVAMHPWIMTLQNAGTPGSPMERYASNMERSAFKYWSSTNEW